MINSKTLEIFRHSDFASVVFAIFALSIAGLVMAGPSSAQAQRGPQTVAPIAEKLIDAVVNISTSQVARGPSGGPLPYVPKGAPFEEYLEDFFKDGGSPTQKIPNFSSLGSGFVIDGKEGLVVTNNHVIDGADEIVVNFNDGKKLRVEKVLGRDSKTDLALLKVKPESPLPEVKFGTSEILKVGDWVMAIGNPFGLGGSVSVGIISAKQRDINAGPYDNFLQTDAAINKGNSGGPLFNMDGEVIGVNTAIISPTGGSIGIGFSVPSDVAANVIEQLRQFGETRRGWLGVRIQSVTEDIAASRGLTKRNGAIVSGVAKGSPAETGGVRAGDIIVRFDGREIKNMRSLPRFVAQTPIGKTVDVEVLRAEERKQVLSIRIGRLKEGKRLKKKPAVTELENKQPKIREHVGLSVAPLTPALRQKFRIGAKLNGVVVTEIDPDSPAARKNIKVGDVIVEAAQSPVKSLADFSNSIAKTKQLRRPAILLQLEDQSGRVRFVAIPLK